MLLTAEPSLHSQERYCLVVFCLLRDGVLREEDLGDRSEALGRNLKDEVFVFWESIPCSKPPIRGGGQEGGVATSDITPLSPPQILGAVAAQC